MRVPRPTLARERQLLSEGARVVVGLDEVGRGALAGPVAVGAVAVTADCVVRAPAGIRDSKELSAGARGELAARIPRWCASSAVGMASAGEIDAWGLTVALRTAALRALAALSRLSGIDVVLLDGGHDYLSHMPAADRFEPPGSKLREFTVVTEVKADAKRTSVAAASIVAKVARDALMMDLAGSVGRYGWERNKGYAAPEHRAGIERWGPSEYHRLSWRLPGAEANRTPPTAPGR